MFVTGFAGAVIWLAAWRRSGPVTGAGAVAFLVAVAVHSVHDGFITLFGVSPSPSKSSIAQSLGQAVRLGCSGAFFATGIGIACFLLGRHAARELTRPGSVESCPPPWRPQIKRWGRLPAERVERVRTGSRRGSRPRSRPLPSRADRRSTRADRRSTGVVRGGARSALDELVGRLRLVAPPAVGRGGPGRRV